MTIFLKRLLFPKSFLQSTKFQWTQQQEDAAEGFEPAAQSAVRCGSGRRHGPGGDGVHCFYLVAWLPWLGPSCVPGPGTWKPPGKAASSPHSLWDPSPHSPNGLPSWALGTLARTSPTSLPSLFASKHLCSSSAWPQPESHFPGGLLLREAHSGQPIRTLPPPPACFLCVFWFYAALAICLLRLAFFLLNICFLWSIFPHCVSLEIKEFSHFSFTVTCSDPRKRSVINRDPVALGERITEWIGPDTDVLHPVLLFYTVNVWRCGGTVGELHSWHQLLNVRGNFLKCVKFHITVLTAPLLWQAFNK